MSDAFRLSWSPAVMGDLKSAVVFSEAQVKVVKRNLRRFGVKRIRVTKIKVPDYSPKMMGIRP